LELKEVDLPNSDEYIPDSSILSRYIAGPIPSKMGVNTIVMAEQGANKCINETPD
jgi:hypothetical protein